MASDHALSTATKGEQPAEHERHIEGMLMEVDYLNRGESACIRMTVKGLDGRSHEIFDSAFVPYFYIVPNKPTSEEDILAVSVNDFGKYIKPVSLSKSRKSVFGKDVDAYKIIVRNPSHVPKLSAALARYGTCYENDIPFARRYLLDNDITPLVNYKIKVTDKEGHASLISMEQSQNEHFSISALCFDIEVYNPLGSPRPEKDPVIMISYCCVKGGNAFRGVITFKKIDLPFVQCVADEKELFRAFATKISELDPDVITGYNSANFDIKYMQERARSLRIDFDMSRFEGNTKIERHGLVDKVKIGGRVHIDAYLMVKFIATVGAAERILKLNSYTLKNVYEAISQEKKFAVEKRDIYKLWDGGKDDLETLATYNLNDADALQKVYDTFIPIMIEMSRATHNVISDVAVSTTGQLVEFTLMRYSVAFNELIPNKPIEEEIRTRLATPIEGAYVKTPDPGVYSNLAIFDFRGLYPSIIISHNIDPSSICPDCKEYYEAPNGVRFSKTRKSIIPVILKQLIEQRAAVKREYKKDPSNIFLGSRSQALKILANSFYGYLGYARSRWYSRDCAASVTAYGRQYIKNTIAEAEREGIRVIYSDTDSIVILLNDKSKEDTLRFMKSFNATLPESMELELEDFYTRGVFVGKRASESGGAKKKYALISESGKIKIRGFELVRRDWSKIARDTQRSVLDAILKEGKPEKAAEIVKDVIARLRSGSVPISELVINTQIRKSIDSYDSKSPEVSAAKKAVSAGLKSREELEHAVIGYVITRHGATTSDKAQLEDLAKDYDPDYYINKQVLPATMKILKELNFNEDQLKNWGTQKKL